MELLNTKLMKFKAYKKLDKNNKTLSEAKASLFFIKKLCKKLQSFVLVCSIWIPFRAIRHKLRF